MVFLVNLSFTAEIIEMTLNHEEQIKNLEIFNLILVELTGSLSIAVLVLARRIKKKKKIESSHEKILSVIQHFKVNKRASL